LNTVYVQRTFRFLFVVIIVLTIIFSLYFLSSVTYPFIIAWIIAFFMNPLVNFLHKKVKLPRFLAVLVVLILIFGIIASLLTLLIGELISITEFLAKNVQKVFENSLSAIEYWINYTVEPIMQQLSNYFSHLNEDQQNTIITNLKEIGSNLATSIASILQSFLSKAPAFFSWFPNAATVLLFTILATFFISKDWYKLKKTAGTYVPIKVRNSSMKVYIELRKALFGFIRAQLTLIFITFLIVLIGLLILRVKYALAIAFIIGIVDLLPILGTGFVFVPWTIYQFIIQNYSLGIGLAVLYAVVIVQRQLMEPKIVASNIGLSPLATIISIFIGLKVIGVLGLIVGPIIAVFINTLHKSGVFHEVWNYIKG